jgi:hypothetical protein
VFCGHTLINDRDQPPSMIQWIFVVIRPKAESMCISFLPVGPPHCTHKKNKNKNKNKNKDKNGKIKNKKEKREK